MKNFFKDAARDYKSIAIRALYLASILIPSELYFLLNNFRGRVYDISTWIDNIIPFCKYFIVAYIFWYIYLGFGLCYLIVRDSKKYFKLLWGINLGMLISCIIFYLFPTVVPRPEVYGTDIFSQLVRMIYHNDNPYNAFPSLHVLESVLVALYVYSDERLERWVKIASTAAAVIIILSTMFVKQHYFYDVAGGTILAYMLYFIFNYKEVVLWIQRKPAVLTEMGEK